MNNLLKRDFYQKALMLKRSLQSCGIKISVLKAREIIAHRDEVTENDLFEDISPSEITEDCKNDRDLVTFMAIKTLMDIAFDESPGQSTKCKMLVEKNTRKFYGIEISNPYKASPRRVTVNDCMIENIGCQLAFEVLHALANSKRNLATFAENDFADGLLREFNPTRGKRG